MNNNELITFIFALVIHLLVISWFVNPHWRWFRPLSWSFDNYQSIIPRIGEMDDCIRLIAAASKHRIMIRRLLILMHSIKTFRILHVPYPFICLQVIFFRIDYYGGLIYITFSDYPSRNGAIKNIPRKMFALESNTSRCFIYESSLWIVTKSRSNNNS